MNRRIFVALSTFGEYGSGPLDLLAESGFSYLLNPLGKRLSREEVIEMGGDCEGIIAGVEPYDEYVIDNMPNLRCISRCGVGTDNVDLEKVKERGIVVVNTPYVVVQPAAELTVAMIFDLMRKLSYHTGLMRQKIWQKKAGNLLAGKSVGILGLGKIGKRVAEIMRRLDTRVYGNDLFPDQQWAEEMGVKIVSLDELLRNSDILSIHLSEIKERPLQLGSDEIEKMKRGSIIVNVSRATFVDESALYNALKEGHLEGAALDVFSEEPYNGPLCDLENVVMTPHLATLTKESRVQMEIEAVRNIIEVLRNERLF